MQDLRQLVYQQNLLLMELLDVLKPQQQQLGFGTPPRPVYVFANRSRGEGVLWYTLSEDADRKVQPIVQTALTGYLQNLEVKQLERRGKDVSKLHIHIKADRTYIIESGLDALFAKSMISSIAVLTPDQVRQPVTIEVQPGDSDEVLFGRLYASGEQIYAPYGENPNWQLLTQAAIDAVRGVDANSLDSVQETQPELMLRLSTLMSFTGHHADQVEMIAASPQLQIRLGQMSESEYVKLRSCLLADYGFKQGVFKSKKDAWNAAREETESLTIDADAVEAWQSLVGVLTQKMIASTNGSTAQPVAVADNAEL